MKYSMKLDTSTLQEVSLAALGAACSSSSSTSSSSSSSTMTVAVWGTAVGGRCHPNVVAVTTAAANSKGRAVHRRLLLLVMGRLLTPSLPPLHRDLAGPSFPGPQSEALLRQGLTTASAPSSQQRCIAGLAPPARAERLKAAVAAAFAAQLVQPAVHDASARVRQPTRQATAEDENRQLQQDGEGAAPESSNPQQPRLNWFEKSKKAPPGRAAELARASEDEVEEFAGPARPAQYTGSCQATKARAQARDEGNHVLMLRPGETGFGSLPGGLV